jgi:hypothetical protein
MITRNLPYFRRTELPTSTALPYFGRHEFDFENPEFRAGREKLDMALSDKAALK